MLALVIGLFLSATRPSSSCLTALTWCWFLPPWVSISDSFDIQPVFQNFCCGLVLGSHVVCISGSVWFAGLGPCLHPFSWYQPCINSNIEELCNFIWSTQIPLWPLFSMYPIYFSCSIPCPLLPTFCYSDKITQYSNIFNIQNQILDSLCSLHFLFYFFLHKDPLFI